MKRSTFRKSSLISSVALLLVAIVALSGATFAWFSASTTAEVNGLSVTSSSASGLLISKDNVNFGSTVDFTEKDAEGKVIPVVLAPASSAFTNANEPAWFSATATSADSYVATSYTELSDTEGFVQHYDLYAKTADNTTKTLKINTAEFVDGGGYGRIAIVNRTTNEVALYWKSADAEGTAAIYPIDATGAVATAYPATPVTTNITATTAVELGQITGTSTHFDIYIWNEGQDAECISNKAGETISGNFGLTI